MASLPPLSTRLLVGYYVRNARGLHRFPCAIVPPPQTHARVRVRVIYGNVCQATSDNKSYVRLGAPSIHNQWYILRDINH